VAEDTVCVTKEVVGNNGWTTWKAWEAIGVESPENVIEGARKDKKPSNRKT